MRFLAAALVLTAFAGPARALSPAAQAVVRGAGLDPASAPVRQADAEGTISTIYQGDKKEFSLEKLALEGAKNGVKMFVSTRSFIRKLKADFTGTPFPTSGYDGLYLTPAERKLAVRKMVE